MSTDGTSRRGFMAIVGAGASAIATGSVAATAPLRLRVSDLQADNLVEPRGLHSRRARLSWKIVSDRRDTMQRAYRVGVASSPERAASNIYDLWDSGWVESCRCFDILYSGAQLASRARCFWKVFVRDDRGEVASSAVASWEMGLLEPDDWKGGWIGAETRPFREDRLAGFNWIGGKDQAGAEGRSFRLALDLPEAAELLIYTIANRQAEVMLDGVAMTMPKRDPAAFGAPPANRATVSVGPGRRVLALFAPGDDRVEPRAAMLVRVTLASGRVLHVSGEQARTLVGKPPEWAQPTFDDGQWPMVSAEAGRAPLPGNGAFLMRNPFQAAGTVRSARLYIAALGACAPWINGERVGEALLAPEWTDFSRRVLYRVYDVTHLVRPGANVLAAMVGDGWYGSYLAPGGRYAFGGPPLRLRAQLELDYGEGRREIIEGDQGWSVAQSSITHSDLYDGEDVDARREQPGWATTSFKLDSRWEPAQVIDTAPVAMVGSAVQPITASLTLRPKLITPRNGGSIVIDFGQNFAGWIRLRTRGEAGRRIVMRFAELLTADGDIDQSNLRAARATDTWILAGDPKGETFEPRFTYHGLRYVRIDGLAAPLASRDIEGVVVRSSLPETGRLTLGQHTPQQLWLNGLWSQRSNFMGIPTDCPQRDERLGWMGDAHVFWDAACFNMDTAAFTRKFMRDVRDGQRDDGSFPDIAPDTDRRNFTGPGSSPGWGDAGVFLPWTSWRRYGDTAVIDEHWDAMERFLESIRAANPDLLWKTRRGNDYGDWLALDAKQPGDPTTPKDLIGTAFWKGSADALADMALATGRADAARRYKDLANAIARAFNQSYVRADGGVGNGSQTGYILALHFDLLPPSLRKSAADRLVADIGRRGGLLSTGFLGTPYSLDVLADAGRHTLVYDLLLRTAYPSWGYMIAHDATTIWERWNGDVGDRSMNSFNHYALGAVAGFMFRRIAGIDPVEPGFTRFRFDPVFDPRLTTGGARFESRTGTIATQWSHEKGAFTLDLSVPANARCDLRLPAKVLGQVRENGRSLSPGRVVATADNGRLQLDIGSGDYRFRVERADFP